jgi:hypothetical protein
VAITELNQRHDRPKNLAGQAYGVGRPSTDFQEKNFEM